MKTRQLITLMGILLALITSRSAVLIEYNFDQEQDPTGQYYQDQSGNNRTVKFHKEVRASNEFPFLAEHPPAGGSPVNPVYPELIGRNKSVDIYLGGTFSGHVSNIEGINLNVNDSFTMEGWINLQGFSVIDGEAKGGLLWIIGGETTTEDWGTTRFKLHYDNEGVVKGDFLVRSQTGGYRFLITDFTLPLNTWTHLAYVYDKSKVLLYINGEVASTLDVPGITTRYLPKLLSSVTIAGSIRGYIDDFRLSDEALARSELGYFKPFTPLPPKSTTLIIR